MSDRSEAVVSQRPLFWDLFTLAVVAVGFLAGGARLSTVIPLGPTLSALLGVMAGVVVGESIRLVWIAYRGPNSRSESADLVSAKFIIYALIVFIFIIPAAKAWNRIEEFRRSI